MHRYRSHNCGELRDGHVGQKIRLSGWCHRIRDHGGVLFIDLRDHYGLTQCVVDPEFAGLPDGGDAALGMGRAARRRGQASPRRHRERGNADRADRGLCAGDRGARRRRRTAGAGVRRPALSRGNPPQIPLHRSAPREVARQYHAARAHHRQPSHAHEGAGLLRVPDADSDGLLARGRARLSGARRGCIPASSTRCRRRRSSSSNC